jgi:hypothetical protein
MDVKVKRKGLRSSKTVLVFVVGVLVADSLWYQFFVTSRHHRTGSAKVGSRQTRAVSTTTPSTTADRCAICLFGLPRAFDSLVLPSLVENVLRPNARHGCDYFVHYYNITHEAPSRSGKGGIISPDDVLRLAEAVDRVARESSEGSPLGRPVTRFTADTADDFWRRRGALVEKVRTVNDTMGRYLYFPWKDKSYQHPTTTDNILMMWHSIQESWNLMQAHAKKAGVDYTRVAVLRSDVFYLTPIDVWELPSGGRDFNNSIAVIPGFGRHPISDRLIYGPSKAVNIWAAQRFERMEGHVQWILQYNPGFGLHSEIFVRRALLEPVRELGFGVEEHPTMCFFRARADETLRTSDCSQAALKTVSAGLETNVIGRVEDILRRKCQGISRGPSRTSLSCARGLGNGTSTQQSEAERAT